MSVDMIVLRTERLILLPLNAAADATLLQELEQQKRVGRFIGRLSAGPRTGQTTNHLGTLLLVIHSENRKIGIVGFVRCDALEGKDVQILCALRESEEGKGYAKEACDKAFEWAFLAKPWPRVLGLVHRDNSRSAKLVRSLGMEELCPRPYFDETIFVRQPSKRATMGGACP